MSTTQQQQPLQAQPRQTIHAASPRQSQGMNHYPPGLISTQQPNVGDLRVKSASPSSSRSRSPSTPTKALWAKSVLFNKANVDHLKLTIDNNVTAVGNPSNNSYPPTPVASPVDLEVYPRDLSYVSPRDMKKMEPSLAPVYELEQNNLVFDQEDKQLREKLIDELHLVFENAQRLDQALSAAEAVAFEQFRIETLEEANAAQEDFLRLQAGRAALDLEEQGRNEKCIEQPWFSRRPRERVIEEMYHLGQEWQRYPQYEKAVLLQEEERIRRETLDEYAYVQSTIGTLSWADLDKVEARALKEKLHGPSVDQEVEARYARVLDEFESFVDGIERSREGFRANELMELERLRKLVLLESEDALAEFQRKEIKSTVVNLEEQERLDRIVRDCSTDYRSIQFAEVTPILDDIRKLAEKKERSKNQRLSIQLMEEERTRRILASAGLFSYSSSS
jgi:hypothetical protein